VKPLSAILAGLAGAFFMAAPATDQVADVVEEKTGRRHRVHDWHSLPAIPEDAALPALGAMRERGVSEALPYLELGTGAVEVPTGTDGMTVIGRDAVKASRKRSVRAKPSISRATGRPR